MRLCTSAYVFRGATQKNKVMRTIVKGWRVGGGGGGACVPRGKPVTRLHAHQPAHMVSPWSIDSNLSRRMGLLCLVVTKDGSVLPGCIFVTLTNGPELIRRFEWILVNSKWQLLVETELQQASANPRRMDNPRAPCQGQNTGIYCYGVKIRC